MSLLALLSLLLLFLLPLAHAGDLQYLMGGTTPTGTDVIQRGAFNPAFVSSGLSSSQSLGTLYLHLSEDSALPSYNVTVRPSSTASDPRKALYIPYVAFTATALDLLTLPVYKLSDVLNEQAQFSSSLGLCAANTSAASAQASIVLSPDGGGAVYDDIAIAFTHDCFYPSVSIGSAPGTVDDILAGQSTPVTRGSSPSVTLTPGAGDLLRSTQTDSTLSLWLSIDADEAAGWPVGAVAPFRVNLASPPHIDAQVTPFTDPLLQPTLNLTVSRRAAPWQVELRVTALCSDAADSGEVVLVVDFFFAQVIRVPIQVQCSQILGVHPWHDLTITSAAIPGNTLYTAGRVTPPYHQPSDVPTLPQQLVTFDVTFAYPANTSYSMTLHAGGSPATAGLIASVSNTLQGSNTSINTLPKTGTLSLTVTTVCSAPNRTFTAFLLVSGRLRGDAPVAYDDIPIYLSWTCTLPAFDLYTGDALQHIIAPETVPNLLAGGRPVASSPYKFDSRRGTAQIFTIDLDDPAVFWDDVALRLRASSPAAAVTAVPFTWTLYPGKSLNYATTRYTMRYNQQRVTGNPPSISFTLPADGSWTPALEMRDMACMAPGDHILTTFLTYGWGSEGAHAVQLDFRRRCSAADPTPSGETGMSAGGITAVVFVVLFLAFCAIGCGYNHGTLGKRGWAVMPGHDWWVTFQDRVLGPKRYTAQMEEEGEEVEIPVTSSTYGTYQGDL